MTNREIARFFKNQRREKRKQWDGVITWADAVRNRVYGAKGAVREYAYKYGFEFEGFDIILTNPEIEESPLAQIKSKYGLWKFVYNYEQKNTLLYHHNHTITKEDGYQENEMNDDEWHLQVFNSKKKPRTIQEYFVYIHKHDAGVERILDFYAKEDFCEDIKAEEDLVYSANKVKMI